MAVTFTFDAPTGTIKIEEGSKRVTRRIHHAKLTRINGKNIVRFVMPDMETLDVPYQVSERKQWKEAIRLHNSGIKPQYTVVKKDTEPNKNWFKKLLKRLGVS